MDDGTIENALHRTVAAEGRRMPGSAEVDKGGHVWCSSSNIRGGLLGTNIARPVNDECLPLDGVLYRSICDTLDAFSPYKNHE